MLDTSTNALAPWYVSSAITSAQTINVPAMTSFTQFTYESSGTSIPTISLDRPAKNIVVSGSRSFSATVYLFESV